MKREERRYGENAPGNDAVVINRGPAARGEQTIGATAEVMADLRKKLCPACQIVVTRVYSPRSRRQILRGSVPIHKTDLYGDNLGVRRTPDSSRPVDLGEALGVGQNVESPQRAALRKRESDRVKNASNALFRL